MHNIFVYIKYKVIDIKEHFLWKHIKKKSEKVMNYDLSQDIIAGKISLGKPFCLIRPGYAEIGALCLYDEHFLFHTNRYKHNKIWKTFNENDLLFSRWAEQYKECLSGSDILAIDPSYKMEEYLIREYASKGVYIEMGAILSFLEKDSWMKVLEGKKVLVVSPFVESMKKQFDRMDLIWEGKNSVRINEIEWQKAAWYIDKEDNDGFENWYDAYGYMKKEIMGKQFDIALLSCSLFGTFLAYDIKKMGKQAIQIGGDFQLFFGIKGKRWDNNVYFSKNYNEYWIRPSEKEAPLKKKFLDEGCYW